MNSFMYIRNQICCAVNYLEPETIMSTTDIESEGIMIVVRFSYRNQFYLVDKVPPKTFSRSKNEQQNHDFFQVTDDVFNTLCKPIADH